MPRSSTMSTTRKEEFSETKAINEIKKKYSEKNPKEILNEQKTNQPSEELFDHFPYIRTNPCIRRVMVAIHTLEYQIPKSCSCISTKTRGSGKNESEVENNESKELESQESLTEGTKKSTSKKKQCLFCTYHYETMLTKKYHESQTAKTLNPACKEKNVIFLLYCINCDEVLVCYTSFDLEFLLDVNFGFYREERCQPGLCHEKRYLRCMIIDRLNETKDSEDGVKICTLIDIAQNTLLVYDIERKETVEKSELENELFANETPKYLKDWDHLLQLGKYLNVQMQKQDPIENLNFNPRLPFVDLNNKILVHRQYHYVPNFKVNELGPNAKTIVYLSDNIVYLISCFNCKIKYVGQSEGTFFSRYKDFLVKATGDVKKHFQSGKKCTFRDMRWTVIDALSDDQIYFLERWSYLFNKSELDVKKMIWGIMNRDLGLESKYKKLLMENVLENDSLKEAIEEIKKETQGQIEKEKIDKDLWELNVANDELEIFLRMENAKWIKDTHTLFIEDRENFWMSKLKTIENGLNQRKGSRSKESCPNFYNNFFKSMSHFKH